MSVVATAVRISLETECDCAEADSLGLPLYQQLSAGRYDECSVLPMPESLEMWRAEHRTARKRADRAERLGYHGLHVLRHEWADDLLAINLSKAERQGRPMSAGYHQRPSETPDSFRCQRHGVHPYGVADAHGHLVAYLWCYRAGELALVSQILGHADHLKNDVMYLLFRFALAAEISHGGWWVYNRHDSGTDGLRFHKERLGFRPMGVEWSL